MFKEFNTHQFNHVTVLRRMFCHTLLFVCVWWLLYFLLLLNRSGTYETNWLCMWMNSYAVTMTMATATQCYFDYWIWINDNEQKQQCRKDKIYWNLVSPTEMRDMDMCWWWRIHSGLYMEMQDTTVLRHPTPAGYHLWVI